MANEIFESDTDTNRESFCTVERLTLDTLKQLVPEPGKYTVRTDSVKYTEVGATMSSEKELDINKRVATTTSEDPAILLEDYASSCTIILGCSQDGRASLIHESIVADYEDEFEAESKWLKTLVNKMKGNLGNNRLFFVGGRFTLDKKVLPLYDDMVEDAIGEDSSVVVDIDNQYEDNNGVLGFIFIPKYIASDGKNHLLVSTRFDTNGDVIFEEWLAIERYLGLIQ